MVRTLIRDVRLVDPEAGREGPGALVLEGGRIAAVLPAPPEGTFDATVEGEGHVLAPGIVDWGVKIGEPGERHRESLRTAGLAAAAGGVTTLVTRPDTEPALDRPEAVEWLLRRAAEGCPVRLHPMAALTKGREGREMAEMGFLRDAGAVAFTDADRLVADSRVMARALAYARGLGALVGTHGQDPWLSTGASATSGPFATLLGLPSAPPVAERIGLERDLALAEAAGAALHAHQVTTAPALEALARAKARGLDVTAGVSIHHVTLNELDIGGYRTFFKLVPPLRAETDREAAVEALASGLLDVLCSWHSPQDEESKRLPFEAAAPGAVGLETLLPAALRLVHAGRLSLPVLFRALSLNPSRRLGLPTGRLAAGAPADLVLFDPDRPFVLDRATLRSKSRNTPFDGARLQGRVRATWVGGRQVFGDAP
ncbi:dihydroorotase [Rubellimicrobium sp. CFH 75288]|uniref:dihydroorotase n=1 Tax=Rubellimicrobium sp. CFH 75288 TaxID=2697034 RepID=UPI0014122C7C|nr:dihydroorotase [Rubellimicrobium sp. CFH 75288]NAZ38029.1 amidohydrolase family protein [Rubellimicrobium sp. CFH 75288]